MGLNLICKITFTQQPTTDYPLRDKVYELDFVNHCEIKSSWRDLTQTAKIILPQNVYIDKKAQVSWAGQYIYANTPTGLSPVLLRGDRVKIEFGYYYEKTPGKWQPQMNIEFEGFITKVNPKIPLEIECEDNMWLLKQALCPNTVFNSTKNTVTIAGKTITSSDGNNWEVTNIIRCLLDNATVSSDNIYLSDVIIPQIKEFVVVNGVGTNENINVNVGDFRTQNETIAQVLSRLRRDYKLETFFRINNLFCSGIVYYPGDYLNSDGSIKSTAYDFQNNIKGPDYGTNLVYLRKDDIRLGIIAYSVNKLELTTTNSAGRKRTKNTRLQVHVGDQDGEIRTQYFWDIQTETELRTLALQQIPRLKYEGWRGSFVSFGLPVVRHGEAVTLKDNVIPERTGTYLVKGVHTTFGMNGFQREVELHMRIDTIPTADLPNGL